MSGILYLGFVLIIFSVFDIPMKYLYGLDSSEEVGISLNLLPLVLKQT